VAIDPIDVLIRDYRRPPGGKQGGQVSFMPADTYTGCMPLGSDNSFVHGKPWKMEINVPEIPIHKQKSSKRANDYSLLRKIRGIEAAFHRDPLLPLSSAL
jgi:hypothetical protein